MKFMMDERVKHRVIGLAVIVSIAAIFAPAIIKKSNQRLDENVSVAVKLPPKPQPPKVVMPEKKAMFATVKVAHVEIPEVPKGLVESTLSKAESLSQLKQVREAVEPMVAKAKIESIKVAQQKPVLVVAATKTVNRTVTTSAENSTSLANIASKGTTQPTAKGLFAVQLATFSKQQNADVLVSKLRAKGYKANYYRVTGKQGMVFKVIVGEGRPKEEAEILQQQLSSIMQINGFVVSTGVS
jgi:DedD protein